MAYGSKDSKGGKGKCSLPKEKMNIVRDGDRFQKGGPAKKTK